MTSQLQQYLPVLMFLLVAVGFAGGTLAFSVVAGKTADSFYQNETLVE